MAIGSSSLLNRFHSNAGHGWIEVIWNGYLWIEDDLLVQVLLQVVCYNQVLGKCKLYYPYALLLVDFYYIGC